MRAVVFILKLVLKIAAAPMLSASSASSTASAIAASVPMT